MRRPAKNRAPQIDRRRFLAGGTTAMAAVAAGVTGASAGFIESLLRDHFRELSPGKLERILRDMEATYLEKYGREVRVSATPAQEGVLFGYGLDLSRCVGCRRCVYACVHENNQSRHPQIHWIRVLQMHKDQGIHLTESDPYYDPPEVPEEDMFYMPVQCQQCENPPCTRVCPVKATWSEPDGIVVVDYDRCIGCRCCMSACPYGARHFNWAEPTLPAEEINPDTHVPRESPAPQGRGREVHVLHPARAQRALPGVCGDLPGGGPQVRQPARRGKRDPLPDAREARVRAEGRSQHEAQVLLLLRDVMPCAESSSSSGAVPLA